MSKKKLEEEKLKLEIELMKSQLLLYTNLNRICDILYPDYTYTPTYTTGTWN